VEIWEAAIRRNSSSISGNQSVDPGRESGVCSFGGGAWFIDEKLAQEGGLRGLFVDADDSTTR